MEENLYTYSAPAKTIILRSPAYVTVDDQFILIKDTKLVRHAKTTRNGEIVPSLFSGQLILSKPLPSWFSVNDEDLLLSYEGKTITLKKCQADFAPKGTLPTSFYFPFAIDQA